MKRFLAMLKKPATVVILLLTLLIVGMSAVTDTVRSCFRNVVVQRGLFVGTGATSIYGRMPDSTCWIEIGSADSSNRAAFLIKWTDTTSIGSRKKVGMVIMNKVDSNLWIYTGRRWKKVGS